LCAGCATGEQFGGNPDQGSGAAVVECAENGDCWDGDPATEDICTADGRCAFLTNVKSDPEKDAEESAPSCQVVAVVDDYAEIDADLENTVVEAVHTVPVEYGVLYEISLDAAARVEVEPVEDDLEGVMFVLLTECTNACKNRIAWGSEICSPVVEAGEYILVVFSERELKFSFTVDLLPPEESCNGLDVTVDC
jgi:hypothetical protein